MFYVKCLLLFTVNLFCCTVNLLVLCLQFSPPFPPLLPTRCVSWKPVQAIDIKSHTRYLIKFLYCHIKAFFQMICYMLPPLPPSQTPCFRLTPNIPQIPVNLSEFLSLHHSDVINLCSNILYFWTPLSVYIYTYLSICLNHHSDHQFVGILN